jgi:hypothetical protein
MMDVVQTSVEDKALLSLYVVARNKTCGLELLRISLKSGEEVVPVFSSGEMAGRFLLSSVLGEGWRVRGCSIGEMVSLLFGPCADIKRVLLNPFPESLAVKDELAEPVYRESFIASLLGGAGN